VSLVNGLVWGGLLGIIAYILYGQVYLGVVMTAAMTLNLLLATCAGVVIPLVRYRLGRDRGARFERAHHRHPDSGGFFIFLGLATLFLV